MGQELVQVAIKVFRKIIYATKVSAEIVPM
jgi:hypothetical protein